ncbi:hypothetical protein KRR23_20550 [Pseudomonas sp. CVAP|uniref:hypothetical protein n=1 Tax=Pseudomonas sp. CVAP\|nr:hypothetical protein [Pseudomonas sp. CVAP\
MRYVKVIAWDSSERGAVDAVHFQFYADAVVYREETIRDTGTDSLPLRKFAQAFLKLGWHKTNEAERYLHILADNRTGDGTPESVWMYFREGAITVYKAVARDLDNDGILELILSSDVNNDGRADRKDRGLVRLLAKEFLKFGWNDRSHAPAWECLKGRSASSDAKRHGCIPLRHVETVIPALCPPTPLPAPGVPPGSTVHEN